MKRENRQKKLREFVRKINKSYDVKQIEIMTKVDQFSINYFLKLYGFDRTKIGSKYLYHFDKRNDTYAK